jgi:type II secretory pathway pseudopilin PulG
MIAARAKKPSRGMTVVAVLVCLIIVTLISGVVLKVSVAQRELARSQERRLQTEWLAESGAQRAMARLARDHDFTGETWSLSAHDLGRSEQAPTGTSPAKAETPAARITISVERVTASANRRRVHIQADYPLDAQGRSRHTKEIMIDLDPSQAGAAP